MRIEFIDPVYYDIITKAVIHERAVAHYKFDVNKMVMPEFKVVVPASPREYEYILAILTVRKKDNTLLTYCYPTRHRIDENFT